MLRPDRPMPLHRTSLTPRHERRRAPACRPRRWFAAEPSDARPIIEAMGSHDLDRHDRFATFTRLHLADATAVVGKALPDPALALDVAAAVRRIRGSGLVRVAGAARAAPQQEPGR